MSSDVVAAARSLAETITGARARTEAERQVPDEVIGALAEADLFRMTITAANAGPETDPLTALDVYETLGRAEASVAWVVWNSGLPCLFSRFLSPEVRDGIFGTPGRKYASSTRPTGKAAREGGDFRVSGRWALVSGCLHADWIALMCLVESDGEVEMVEPGMPNLRMAFVPRHELEIVDTWHVGGLRGTGSHDVVADGLEVPGERTFFFMDPVTLDHPLGRMPIVSVMAAGHASLCLGIADAALEATVELGRTKVSPDPAPQMPDRASNQFAVAHASARLSAMRREVRARVAAVWERAVAGEGRDVAAVAALWTAAVACSRDCRAIVDELYEAAGTAALYDHFVLERAHRDVHAAAQHIIVQRFWIEDAGRVLFGMEPTSPLFML